MSVDPGVIVPSAAEIDRSWFKWKHWHEATAQDPRACWSAGMKRSYELALEQLIGLETTLRRHLEVMQEVQTERLVDRGGSATYQNTEYRHGYHAAIADTAVFAGLVQTERLLLSMLTEWRIEQDIESTVEEIEQR